MNFQKEISKELVFLNGGGSGVGRKKSKFYIVIDILIQPFQFQMLPMIFWYKNHS